MTKIERLWANAHVYRRDDISPKATKFYYYIKNFKAFGSITIIKDPIELHETPTKARVNNEARKDDLFNLLNEKWHEWQTAKLNRNVRYGREVNY